VILALWSGLAAGSLHVVSGVDHLAAVLPLAVGRRGRAFLIGAAWGGGHSLGVAVIGLVGVLLRERLDLHRLSNWAEGAVGVMLVGLGLVALRGARRHMHPAEPGTAPAGDHAGARSLRTALAAGTVHGVAGGAHLLGVLPALVLGGWQEPVAYLAAFGLGTVGSMGAFALVLGHGGARLASRGPRAVRRLSYAAGLTAMAVGLAWLAAPALEAFASR
jgi:hypothetical protein